MPVKAPPAKSTTQGPIPLPDEISPTIYIQQFVEWLQTSEPNVTTHHVRLRLAWLHAKSSADDGVVTYGEIGAAGQRSGDVTLALGMTPDLKKFLKGTAAIYHSDTRRFEPALKGQLSQKQSPFNPDKAGQVEVTIWTGTGEIELKFLPKQLVWRVIPHYAATANLLYGFATGKSAPSARPMVMLSLAKTSIDTVE